MNILITGISGFLGRHLNSYLSHYNVIGIDIIDGHINGTKVYSSKNINCINENIDYLVMCHAAVASGSHTVSNDLLYEVNVKLTEQILTTFKDVPTVYISTASIYSNDTVIKETSKVAPRTGYAMSKFWAEQLVLSNPNSTLLRLSSLYGIGMKENTLIPNYVNQAINKKEIQVWGDGSRKQNYVHVNEVGNIIKHIITKKELTYGKTLLGVASKEFSNHEIANIIAAKCNAKINFVNVDNSKSNYYNSSFTQKLLGLKSKNILETELNTYIEWKLKK